MTEQDRQGGAVRTDPAADDGSVAAAPAPLDAGARSLLRRLLPGLLLVGGIAVGFFAALLVMGRLPLRSAAPAPAPIDAAADDAPPVVVAPDTSPADAASGRAAVERFIAAEVDGNVAESYRYLSATDRDAFRSAGGWEAAHADVLPPITGFEPRGVDQIADGVAVRGTLRLEPTLDEVVGLVPAVADATWVAVADASGTWGVDLEASTLEPRYPPDDGAVDAAAAWVRTRQGCQQVGEYDGGLVGVTGPAAALCNARGDVEVGRPEPLDDVDAAPFQAAFGDDAAAWARVVDVSAPKALRVVLAPVGDAWLVVGVLPPSGG